MLKKLSILPRRAVSHTEITHLAKTLCIPHFRGVFTRDRLPRKMRKRECAVLNLDDAHGPGTHYVAYVKREDNSARYFDSFGLPPPLEFLSYARGCRVTYNVSQVQRFDSENCGRLCLQFLFYEWTRIFNTSKERKKPHFT